MLVLAAAALAAATGASAARIRGTAGNDRVQAYNGRRDAVSCGRGRDIVTADSFDRVASDCEVVSRQISVDPFQNPQSQHETQVEPDSFAVGSSVLAAFQSGRIFNGGSSDIGFSFSRNRGVTWTRGSAVLVSSSSDGLHWGAPVTATLAPTLGPLLLDKEWIVCDNGAQSPFRGHCYVSYSDFRTNEVSTQTTVDGGVTWGLPIGSSDAAGRASLLGSFAPGVQPVVRPDGMVVIPYYDEGKISAIRSTDGGATYSTAALIAPARYRIHSTLRAAPLPVAEADASGAVYVAWTDCSRRPGCSRNDVLVARSSDGVSWSAPVRVPTGSADAELPGLAADPTSPGRLALAYYTLTSAGLDAWFVSSRNAGATWTKPQRLSARSVSLNWIAATDSGVMVGDYISTSFAGGRAVPVFALARHPNGPRFHESMFAASVPVPR
ncbi:MAG: exo-alpha-sialidase [Actinobacteria bacterium]|nr:MAG: exo-alpha-sialidase [Actinomycetota bacterium]